MEESRTENREKKREANKSKTKIMATKIEIEKEMNLFKLILYKTLYFLFCFLCSCAHFYFVHSLTFICYILISFCNLCFTPLPPADFGFILFSVNLEIFVLFYFNDFERKKKKWKNEPSYLDNNSIIKHKHIEVAYI